MENCGSEGIGPYRLQVRADEAAEWLQIGSTDNLYMAVQWYPSSQPHS